MASPDARSSSQPPDGSSMEESLAYYKSQYEQLEAELQEFQTSSRELEAELEKDIEASEKRERQLKGKVEDLGFEVDEWKTKYKQSKTEASNAQNTLQKEITTLRDTSRTLQLRLRDIEVANDDYERQARNTTSSLEDLESKYNVAIERGVMLEEEIKAGEQEREALRIESQRLKEELSELKVEAEIVQEKLRLAETNSKGRFERRRIVSAESTRERSPASAVSVSAASLTTDSSPTPSTPPAAKSDASATSDALTPPSPPISEKSGGTKLNPSTPAAQKSLSIEDMNVTPKPYVSNKRTIRHSRGPSIPMPAGGRSTPSILRTPLPSKSSRPSMTCTTTETPRSGSLYQIRGLIGRMQKLEARVQSARSKLPAPTTTPPRASPRSGSALDTHIPSTVTVRSGRKRASGIVTPSASSRHGDVSATTPTSRLSFGVNADRPPSSASASRPASRTSVGSYSATMYARPSSRQGTGGARTPLPSFHRPRSSLSGTFENVSTAGSRTSTQRAAESRDDGDAQIATPRRRQTDKQSVMGVATPLALSRRQSGNLGGAGNRLSTGSRRSFGYGGNGSSINNNAGNEKDALDSERPKSGPGLMGPPDPPGLRRKLSEVGETY